MASTLVALPLLATVVRAQQPGSDGADRPRVRQAGIVIGALPPGPLDAITDVPGVRVGQVTVRSGDSLRTGVTAILPHAGNLFRDKVHGAMVVGNGFGKLIGLSQVNELGWIETPILLTGTLSVWRAADALVDTMLEIPENRDVVSINPVVGETNDGWLSDIRARPVTPEEVREALRRAHGGPVEEGSVGRRDGDARPGLEGRHRNGVPGRSGRAAAATRWACSCRPTMGAGCASPATPCGGTSARAPTRRPPDPPRPGHGRGPTRGRERPGPTLRTAMPTGEGP